MVLGKTFTVRHKIHNSLEDFRSEGLASLVPVKFNICVLNVRLIAQVALHDHYVTHRKIVVKIV